MSKQSNTQNNNLNDIINIGVMNDYDTKINKFIKLKHHDTYLALQYVNNIIN